MGETFACEKWGDGSWWVATLPEGWHWKRDQSIKGWPYVCTWQDARLIIHHHFSGGQYEGPWDWSIVPASIQSEPEREMYLNAATDLARLLSRRFGHGPSGDVLQHALMRHEFNELIGYSYEREGDGERTWRGYFVYKRWCIRAGLHCGESVFDDALQASLEILSSIRFFESSPV